MDFLTREHGAHHKPDLGNIMETGMMIETSFISSSESPDRVIGLTLQSNALGNWILSDHIHVCSCLSLDVQRIFYIRGKQGRNSFTTVLWIIDI